MKRSNFIFAFIVGLLIFYVGNRAAEMYFMQPPDISLLDKVNNVSNGLDEIFSIKNLHISTAQNDLLGGCGFLFCYAICILYIVSSRHNFMYGKEHGSAEWGTASDIAPLIDKKYENNILLTQTERISLNTRQTFLNDNVLVVGGSGSGKTRFVLKPNLMQMHSSYVITDPKGTVLTECGKMLADNGYLVKSLNTVDFEKSMHYNPFCYLHSQEDILVLADLVIKNCGGKDQKEDFWVQSERLLYNAIFGYVYYVCDEKDKNFDTVLKMISEMKVVDENDDSKENAIDVLFEELEAEGKADFAVANYKQYKLAAGVVL